MTNFTFLTSTPDFSSFAGVAESAERLLHIDIDACVLNCRRAMEFAVKWMYSVDRDLDMPYQDNLVSLMNDETFRDIMGEDIWRRMEFIRKLGNKIYFFFQNIFSLYSPLKNRATQKELLYNFIIQWPCSARYQACPSSGHKRSYPS